MTPRPPIRAWCVLISLSVLVGIGANRFAAWATRPEGGDLLIGSVQWRALGERFDALPSREDLAALTRRVSLVEEANSASAVQLAMLDSWRLQYARSVDAKIDLVTASVDRQNAALVTMSDNIGKLTGILTVILERKPEFGQ